ncbi:MAG: beta-lactamase family protein [Oligoflexia bacterium]|nr:beta-lactamase family protein [Oligoflexia bacterium]
MSALNDLVSNFASHTHSPASYCALFDTTGIVKDACARCQDAPPVGTAISSEMQFPIASITKSFAAVAILKLRDQGKLSLRAPFWSYLPEWTHGNRLSAGVDVTIEDLLTHSAGLPTDDPWGDRQLLASQAELLQLLQNGPSFDIPVGERYRYSNLGYMILGLIISSVAGVSARTFIENEIIAPLGMRATTFVRASTKCLAQGYRRSAFGAFEREPTADSNNDGAVFGGLFSCAADLVIWARFFLQSYSDIASPWDSVLSKASRREAQTLRQLIECDPKVPDLGFEDTVDGRGYGYGLRVFARSEYLAVGHSGGLPGVGCHLRWVPARGIGSVAVSMCSYGPAWSLARTALDAFAEQRVDAQLRASSSSVLAESLSQQLLNFATQRNVGDLERVFSSNFFLDTPESEWRKALTDWLNKGSTQVLDGARLIMISKLAFAIERIDGRRMKVLLSPETNPRIQKISFI